jgi:hypothetical protein
MPAWGHLSEAENLKNKNMDRAAAKIGNVGERATMRLLDGRFAADPDLCILHDLHIPTADGRGAEPANVDHVIISGGRVLLIDSKSWKPGRYKTRRSGATYRDRQPFPAADTHTLDMAANRYATHLTRHGITDPPQWIGVTAVWPTSNNRTSLRGIRHTPNDTRNPLTVLYCKGPHLPHLVAALTHRQGAPDDRIVNAFLPLLRKPAPR